MVMPFATSTNAILRPASYLSAPVTSGGDSKGVSVAVSIKSGRDIFHSKRFSVTYEQRRGLGGNAFAAPSETEMLGGGGFHGHGIDGEGKVMGDILNHLRDERQHPGGLRDDGHIDIDGPQGALFPDDAGRLAQQHTGICPFVSWIRVGEVKADVAQGGSAQHSVGEGMEGDIGVAVAHQAEMIRDVDPANNQSAAFHEAVHVETVAYPEHTLYPNIRVVRC